MKKTSELYERYEHLAQQYAQKLFNYENTGWEKKDLIQEMKLKILTTIVAYKKKWREYALTKRYKPIHFEIYLRSALDSKVKDFIKKFNKDLYSNGRISIQETDFDCGHFSSDLTIIDFVKNVYIVRGVDLMEGLNTKEEKICFSLYLKQKPMPLIRKILKNKDIDPKDVINKQVERLKTRENELLRSDDRFYKSFSLQEE